MSNCNCGAARRLERLVKFDNSCTRSALGNDNFRLAVRVVLYDNPPPVSPTAENRDQADKFDALNADEDRMVELEETLEKIGNSSYKWARRIARRALEVKP